jgi:hypothetical protein
MSFKSVLVFDQTTVSSTSHGLVRRLLKAKQEAKPNERQ